MYSRRYGQKRIEIGLIIYFSDAVQAAMIFLFDHKSLR